MLTTLFCHYICGAQPYILNTTFISDFAVLAFTIVIKAIIVKRSKCILSWLLTKLGSNVSSIPEVNIVFQKLEYICAPIAGILLVLLSGAP
jgi:hypothetical protein